MTAFYLDLQLNPTQVSCNMGRLVQFDDLPVALVVAQLACNMHIFRKCTGVGHNVDYCRQNVLGDQVL